jgi:APA family basic amino acid/polyamine antiporter
MGGLLAAELGTYFPQAGGPYVYLREAIHPLVGFLYGWTLVLIIQTGSNAAVAIGFATFASEIVPLSPIQIKLWATSAIFFLTAINCLGVKKGAGLLDAVTSLKVLAMALFIGGVFFLPPASHEDTSASTFQLSSYGIALIAVFWAFDGWNNVTFVAGEIKNPRRNLPWALFIGIAVVTLLYFLMNFSYYKILSVPQIVESNFVAADTARLSLGQGTVWAMTILVVLSCFGCVNGGVLTGSRVIYAMARDRALPEFLATLHPKTGAPQISLLAQGVWTTLLIWSGTYDQLFTYVVFAACVFYTLSAVAVFQLRKAKAGENIYTSPFYPILPLVYGLAMGAITLNALIERPLESLAGLGILALGVP